MYTLSIVIPVFNDEEVIEELFKRLDSSLTSLNQSAEVILIDDGSQDKTIKTIENYSNLLEKWNLKLIKLMRNFGQMAAISAA